MHEKYRLHSLSVLRPRLGLTYAFFFSLLVSNLEKPSRTELNFLETPNLPCLVGAVKSGLIVVLDFATFFA